MPEFFLELFSEEIPARMQARAAEASQTLLSGSLGQLMPTDIRTWYGPRRIAVAAQVQPGVGAVGTTERGPRLSAPAQAVEGFLRKHGATREQLHAEGEYYVLKKPGTAMSARDLIAAKMPELLRSFSWPKSMRWGGSSQFTWVRPLRRICAVLDGEVVPFDLRDGTDDGHGLAAGDLSEGHRFLAPEPFRVRGADQWATALRGRHVLADAAERRRVITEGLADLAAEQGMTIVADAGLLDEVTNLVEWPVPLLGRIDAAYMDLPAEVMQVSMRVNQRYFALRDARGAAAPFFGFVANIVAGDGGRAIVAGNERVLRARFADARYFWDLDRQTKLADRVAALDAVTFHAKLGSQGARVRRLMRLAGALAPLVGADVAAAERAALLAKADLTTGMVGEFPELQGIMGGYYAAHDGEPSAVAAAVRDHYAPRGASDDPPAEPVAIAVALADKLDQLAGFFALGERPSGSGDPYALRRAALGVIRTIRERALSLDLDPLHGVLNQAALPFAQFRPASGVAAEVFGFIVERLQVQLRAAGVRHDTVRAVFESGGVHDINRLIALARAIGALLATADGEALLAGYRRAANILRIEEKRGQPLSYGRVDPDLLTHAEQRLADTLASVDAPLESSRIAGAFDDTLRLLASLRDPIDRFFDAVMVNDENEALRQNRLNLLAGVRRVMNSVADFSKIES